MRRGFNKFNAKRTNGFASKLESAVFDILTLRQRAGEIKDLRCQHVVVLQDGPKEIKINWKIDYSYTDTSTNRLCFAEAKGVWTQDFIIKLKLFKKLGIGQIEIWGGNWRSPKILEKWVPSENIAA